jgi:hemerythrin superfamily protein
MERSPRAIEAVKEGKVQMNASTTVRTGNDVIAFLKEQHERVQVLLERVAESRGARRSEAFRLLRRLLAIHETAEEMIVHPAARRSLANGESLIAMRLSEERQAKRTLMDLEKLNLDSPAFERKFQIFKVDVLAHAHSEETQEFAALARELNPKTLERMRRAAELTESIAPTRPHPGVESAMANLLLGPFAAIVDRSRDALAARR